MFVVGLPVLGAAVDEVTGGGVGWVFAGCTVLGALLAVLRSSRRGWWWVCTAPPFLVLPLVAGAELVAHPDRYQGRNLATGAANWSISSFPVAAGAVGAALLAIVIRIALDRRSRRG